MGDRKLIKLSLLPSTQILLLVLIISPNIVDCKIKTQIKMLISSSTLREHQFKPAVTGEALPDSIYYNKHIPLIFLLNAPEWSTDSLRLNASLHCSSDRDTSSPICPIAYHFERLLSPLADAMRFSKNIYTPSEGWSYFGKIDCQLIEPHFSHLSATTEELQLYIAKIKQTCPLAKYTQIQVKNLTNHAASHLVTANKRFQDLINKNDNGGNVNGGNNGGIGGALSSAGFPSLFGDNKDKDTKLLQMTAFAGFQTAYLLTKYMDTLRWSNAFSSCQSYKLNIGLIHSFMLQSALSPIRRIAESNGYKLSIPLHEFLPHYYKLPITDCVLGIKGTKATTLMIRLLVPVQKKETKYTRIRLTKIPYLITEGGQKKICEIDSFDPNDDFIIEESEPGFNSKPVITTAPDCYENELCHVAEQPRRMLLDPCLKALMNSSLSDIREFCSFECYSVENEAVMLPIIIKIASNEYSITGGSQSQHGNHPIAIYCSNKFFKTIEPNETNGVMQVILPCNCDIRYKAEIYKSTKPCDHPYEAHYLTTIPKEGKWSDDGNGSSTNTGSGMPDQLLPASWILPPGPNNEKDTLKSNEALSSHNTQFAFIWILLVLIILTNLLLLYIAYYNRLFSYEMIRHFIPSWGICTRAGIRGRLEDEHGTYPNNQQDNNSAWPTNLNRL